MSARVFTTPPRRRDPLGPIDLITWLALALLFALVAFMVSSAFLGWHPSVGNWGNSHPCLEVPQAGLWIGGSGGGTDGVQNLRPGVTQGYPNRFRLCQEAMSTTDRTLSSVPVLLDLLWTIGFLLLTRRMIKRARRGGLFTSQLASALQGLGWYVLAGWVGLQAIGATCTVLVTSHLVTEFSPAAAWPAHWHWSWATMIGGFGLLTIARVIRESIPLREEVDATV
ncbi:MULTISPECIES: hypothetical protein [unclassified Luteococcus]|uniref:hypothetical protein n=1 Tax=unclassified Luteococcus TaxID=2639923 RepID=UPI00313B33D2